MMSRLPTRALSHLLALAPPLNRFATIKLYAAPSASQGSLQDLPPKQRILALIPQINAANKFSPDGPNLTILISTLVSLPLEQQIASILMIAVHAKSIIIEHPDQSFYETHTAALFDSLLAGVPQLREHYRTMALPQSVSLQEAVDLAMVLSVVLPEREDKEEFQKRAMKLIFSRINEMNMTAVSCFLADAVMHRYKVEFEDLEYFYIHGKINELRGSYRYFLLNFMMYHLDQGHIYPLLSVFPTIRNALSLEGCNSVWTINSYLKTMMMEFEISNRTVYKILPTVFNRHMLSLQRALGQRSTMGVNVIELYNTISDIYPLGSRFVKEILSSRDTNNMNVGREPEVKKFVLHLLTNLQPQYIYSIDEKPTNEVNQPLITLAISLIRYIVETDPKFILEISDLYPHLFHYNPSFWRLVTNTFSKKALKDIPSIQQEPTAVYKYINTFYLNRDNLPLSSWTIQKLLQSIKEMPSFPSEDPALWKCIFQSLAILSKKIKVFESNQVVEFYNEYCVPYMEKQIALEKERKGSVLIRELAGHEEYILRIANLIKAEYFQKRQAMAKTVVDFINLKFIYSVKSVIKEGVTDILHLLSMLPPVSPEIHAYLYSNLSSFINYIQSTRKFFLQKGKNQQYDKLYITVLKRASEDYKLLSQIKNKDRLNIISILALKYWGTLSNTEIAKILLMFGDPALLGDRMRNRLRQVQFTLANIVDLDLAKLSVFMIYNESLEKAIAAKKPYLTGKHSSMGLHSINFGDKEEVKEVFQNKMLYEQCLEMREFTQDSLVPEPSDDTPQTKMVYVCLQAIAKIRKNRNYSIEAIERGENPIDLSEQIRYIQNNNLTKQDDLNEFKLDNVDVHGHYEMIEGWNIYDIYENLTTIEEFNSFGNSDDNHYERILNALCGNYSILKQLIKKETFYSEVLSEAQQLGLDAYPKGSLIEISHPTTDAHEELYILCSNSTNYKLHILYAYFLEKLGFKAFQVDEKATSTQISEFLKKSFPSDRVISK